MKKIGFIVLVVISSAVYAQDEIVTDRPDATESALTIPIKSFQFETGITYLSEQSISSYTLPEYLLRFGLIKILELRVESSFDKREAIDGLQTSDLNFGLKLQIIKKEKFNLALLSHANLPEVDRSELLFTEKLLLSYEINDNTEVGINLGVDGVGGNSDGVYIYTIAIGKGVTDKFGFFIESFGEFSKDEDHYSYLDGGISYLMKSRIQLDTKFGVDAQYFKNYFVGVGISVRMFN